MSLKDIDGSAITTKYIIKFINIFVAQRIFVTKRLNKIYLRFLEQSEKEI